VDASGGAPPVDVWSAKFAVSVDDMVGVGPEVCVVAFSILSSQSSQSSPSTRSSSSSMEGEAQAHEKEWADLV